MEQLIPEAVDVSPSLLPWQAAVARHRVCSHRVWPYRVLIPCLAPLILPATA